MANTADGHVLLAIPTDHVTTGKGDMRDAMLTTLLAGQTTPQTTVFCLQCGHSLRRPI